MSFDTPQPRNMEESMGIRAASNEQGIFLLFSINRWIFVFSHMLRGEVDLWIFQIVAASRAHCSTFDVIKSSALLNQPSFLHLTHILDIHLLPGL